MLENSYAMIINSLPKKADNPKSECFRVKVQLQCLLKCLRLRQRRFYGIIFFFSFLLLVKLLFNLHILSALYYSSNIIIMHSSLCTWKLCDVVSTGVLVCKVLMGLLYIRKKETLWSSSAKISNIALRISGHRILSVPGIHTQFGINYSFHRFLKW